jgi:hypothetical protein
MHSTAMSCRADAAPRSYIRQAACSRALLFLLACDMQPSGLQRTIIAAQVRRRMHVRAARRIRAWTQARGEGEQRRRRSGPELRRAIVMRGATKHSVIRIRHGRR